MHRFNTYFYIKYEVIFNKTTNIKHKETLIRQKIHIYND